MDNINKIISFILGLVVVAIFLVILSGRLDLGKRFFTASWGQTVSEQESNNSSESDEMLAQNTEGTQTTPNPTRPAVTQNPQITPARAVQGVSNIPNTGADVQIGLLLIAGLSSGAVLWKMSKK